MKPSTMMMLLTHKKSDEEREREMERRYNRDMRSRGGDMRHGDRERSGKIEWDDRQWGNDHRNIENRYDGEYRYDYDGDRGYNNMPRGGIRYEYRPEIEDAYTDRRGRRHYDNGRYAPESRYMPYPLYPVYNDDYSGTRMGFTADRGYEFDVAGKAGNMIGRARGNLIPMKDMGMEELDERTAKKWAENMKNEDGTKGPHWTMEQTTKVMKDMKEDFDPIEFWLAMNATYSDYCMEFKKHGITTPQAMADFAIAFWLCDEDANVENKLSAYYNSIVK